MYYWNKIYLYIISCCKNTLFLWHTENIGRKTLSDYIFYWYYLLRILFFSIFGKKLYKIIKGIMANKRILKRKINYVCSELFSEVVAASYSIKADEENVKALLTSILVIHNACRAGNVGFWILQGPYHKVQQAGVWNHRPDFKLWVNWLVRH